MAGPLAFATTVFKPMAPVRINIDRNSVVSLRDICASKAGATPETLYTCLSLRQICHEMSLFCIGIHLPAPSLRWAFAHAARCEFFELGEIKS